MQVSTRCEVFLQIVASQVSHKCATCTEICSTVGGIDDGETPKEAGKQLPASLCHQYATINHTE